jgi:DNA-binding transcriptional regulator YiaG
MERTKLKAAREAKGLREGRHISQQDVADAIGCSRDSVSLWERGLADPQGHYVDQLLRVVEQTRRMLW